MKSYHSLLFSVLIVLGAACGHREPRQPDLPKQPDRWVSSVALDQDSKVQYIGKTRNLVITDVSKVQSLDAPRSISVGDEIEGIRVAAIKCSFHWADASYGGEQFMWRGRWSCQAGRSRQEVETAVGDEGQKRFDYILVGPVTLGSE
jgi:hypothetical protein